MRGLVGRILAGTAVALVFAAHADAAPQNIEAAIPVPESANVPPPSKADLGPQPAFGSATTATTTPPAPATPAATSPAEAPPAPAPVSRTASTSPEATFTVTKPEVPASTPGAKPLTGKDLIKAPIATNLASFDASIAEKLRELVANKLGQYLDNRRGERSAVEAFYRDRGFAPLWSVKGAPTPAAVSAIKYLHGVDAEGLEPADYPTPDYSQASDIDAIAEADLKLTDSVITFARHASTGRVHFTRVSGDILYDLKFPDPADVLTRVSSVRSAGDVLASYNPPHAGYKALKAKLAEVRTRKLEPAPARIETGPLVKAGMMDPRVPLLRERLGLPAEHNNHYDKNLAIAVAKFQKQKQLQPTGNLNNATVAALNGPKREREADIIIANMERWRWLPRDLGKAYSMLNIPDFTLKVVNNGATVWTTKVVTGKPGKMATPMLSETMKFITVNPTWNVPPSIINNEYLPALQQDPTALERIGLKVEQNPDGTVRIYQPPGDGNALGRLRFNFPNKFLVYQHDTSDKHLFAHERRAYSHGCMRVQFPDKYAETILSISNPKDGFTIDKIKKMYGPSEININLANPLWVHITYQTAFVDEHGKLQIRDDLYGRDAETLSNLRGEARKVADIPIERKQEVVKPEVFTLPGRYQNPFAGWFTSSPPRTVPQTGGRRVERYPARGSDNFFERIFR
jgi:murein L,D-transpeptidase YcbB/YkuD